MKLVKWDTIKNVAGQVWDVASYGLMLAATYKVADYISGGNYSAPAGYDDAVGAIMNSGMFSHDKREAVSALKRYGTQEFYKAIVHIAEDSSMYSHDKVEMIKTLSSK